MVTGAVLLVLLSGCLISSASLWSFSKKVKLSGVVTEDKVTGERYVTHVTVVEETMGAKQPEVQQTDSQSAVPSEKQPRSRNM